MNKLDFSQLREDNYIFFAMANYDNPSCLGVNDFYEDTVCRIIYLKRMLNRYLNGNVKKSTINLMLNHTIAFCNNFGHEANRMLFFKLEEKHYELIKTVLLFLDRIAGDEIYDGVDLSCINISRTLYSELEEI